MSKHRFAVAASVAALLVASACRRPAPPVETPPPTVPPTQGVVLPAPSTEPRYAITTTDPDEIALLAERLRLRQVLVAGSTLYFAADEPQLQQLRELGYEVGRVDADQVDGRVLRVQRRGTEEALREFGVTVINREPAYWIISGKLAQLRRLVAAGYRLEALAPDEPRERWIRIEVPTRDDVQRVANFQVDIFGVADSAGRFIIRGAAMDMQIDRLRQAGFTVVLLPRP
jgi:hypothetical protein